MEIKNAHPGRKWANITNIYRDMKLVVKGVLDFLMPGDAKIKAFQTD